MKHSKTPAPGDAGASPRDVAPADEAAATPPVAPDLGARIAELEAELARIQDERLRAEADLQNARRRAARESDEAERRGEARAFGAFLGLIDDLERARGAAGPAEQDGALLSGVSLVLTRALDELARLGISAIDPHGDAFDPHSHEALLSAASEQHPAGAVSQVIARGYRQGERLLRPARVVVSTGPADRGPGTPRDEADSGTAS
ncbi:MAG: nucleotide exchange factor GrpE [Candidatus Eisenbacteria bacterium]